VQPVNQVAGKGPGNSGGNCTDGLLPSHPQVPSSLLRQARVTLNGRDHLLGPYGSAAGKQAYGRLVAK